MVDSDEALHFIEAHEPPQYRTAPLTRLLCFAVVCLSSCHCSTPLPRHTDVQQKQRPHDRGSPRASEVTPSHEIPKPRTDPIARRATCANKGRDIRGITSQIAHEKRFIDLHVFRDAWNCGFDEGEQDVKSNKMAGDVDCRLGYCVGGVCCTRRMGHSQVCCWLEVEEVGAIECGQGLPEAEVDFIEER